MLKQQYGYGCGMYAVANALNMPGFATDERLKESKKGNNIGQLSNWLFKDGHDVWIDTLKYTGRPTTLPKIEVALAENVVYWPALISIPLARGRNHMIALKVTNECRSSKAVEVLDSLLDEPIYLADWNEVKEIYPKVYGFFCFRDFNNQDIFFIRE